MFVFKSNQYLNGKFLKLFINRFFYTLSLIIFTPTPTPHPPTHIYMKQLMLVLLVFMLGVGIEPSISLSLHFLLPHEPPSQPLYPLFLPYI